jgi:hypothetical protein
MAFLSGVHYSYRYHHKFFPNAEGQRSVVVDPRAGLGYDTSLFSQIQRKINVLPAFEGLVVDRSDWNQVVNFDGDDGFTFVGNATDGAVGWSMKHSYLHAIGGIRAVLDTQKAAGKPKVMLTNGVGYSWLPFMEHFDGTYSEGGNTNAAGLLGLTSTSIMWVYPRGPGGTYSTPMQEEAAVVDAWFQRHVRMNVFPMAPFPDNDHAIDPSPAFDADYLRYGPFFNAIKRTSWVLDAEPIKLIPSHATAGMQTNALVTQNGTTFIYPVVLGQLNASSVDVVITVPTALLQASGGTSVADAALRGVGKDAGGGGIVWSVLHPTPGAVWQPVKPNEVRLYNGKATLTVPLVTGCALLRAE